MFRSIDPNHKTKQLFRSIDPNYETKQGLGQSTQTKLTSHLEIFVFCILPLLGRFAIELPHLSGGHDIPYLGSLIGPLLVPHVEVARDVIKPGLVVRSHNQHLPDLELLLLMVGIIPLSHQLNLRLHIVFAVYLPEIAFLDCRPHFRGRHFLQSLGHDDNSFLIIIELLTHDLRDYPINVCVFFCLDTFLWWR